MKTLTVLRHAKSSWDDGGVSDFERRLNDRGIGAARRMGQEMKRRGMRFDLVLASPAVRVRETLNGAAEGYGSRFDVEFEDRIYMASAAALLDLIRAIPDESKAVLLVGHNPGLQNLLVMLTADDDHGRRSRVRDKYPTGAVAVVEFPLKQWSGVEPGSGEIAELILPRELDD